MNVDRAAQNLAAVAMDGAVEVLETLQCLGLALGLVTNGTVRAQAQKLDLLGLRPYFRTVVISENERRRHALQRAERMVQAMIWDSARKLKCLLSNMGFT